MRELTVRIRFTRHCLGSVKSKDGTGRFLLPRSPQGNVIFLAAWHAANMNMAAQVLGRHQDEVKKIYWDINVDGSPGENPWFRRYYSAPSGIRRYSVHEAFFPGWIVGLNCLVPTAIPDEDVFRLMRLAGQYKGLSPWKPGEYGLFDVDRILPRRVPPMVPPGAIPADPDRMAIPAEALVGTGKQDEPVRLPPD